MTHSSSINFQKTIYKSIYLGLPGCLLINQYKKWGSSGKILQMQDIKIQKQQLTFFIWHDESDYVLKTTERPL